MKLLPGMVVMTYHDCGTNTIQAGQVQLIERLHFEGFENVHPDRYGCWIVVRVNEEDEPINDYSWVIDEHAPVEVLFAPPQDFNPDDYRTGIGPTVWTFR
jgi:hypothetical protein